MSEKKVILITIIALVYSSINIACDPLAFRLISIFGITLTGSGLLYSIRYPLLDLLTRLSGRKTTILLLFAFHLSDILFVALLYFVNLLPAPNNFNVHPYTVVFSHMPHLLIDEFFGSIVAGIIEIFIFSFLQNHKVNFFLSTIIATISIMLAHNVTTEYLAWKNVFPTDYIQLITANFLIGVFVLIFCTSAINLFLKAKLVKRVYA